MAPFDPSNTEPTLQARTPSSRIASHSSSRSDSVRGSNTNQKDSGRYHVDSNTRGGRRARRRNKEGSGLDALALAMSLKQPSLWEDVCSIISLTFPIMITMIPWVFMKTTDTIIAGHLGTSFLIALAMSELWTSATGVLLNGSVLGVFVGKAMSAGEHGFAGEWLQVSLVVVGCISLAVAGSWACTGDILQSTFDVDESLAKKAQYYSLIFAIAIPARVLLNDFTQYYRAQQHSMPSVVAGLIATVLNAIVCVVVVLGEPSDWFQGFQGLGFIAAPIVPVVVTYLQLFIMYLISPRMECWPGWSLNHITKHRVVEFLREYLPSSFSSASDWWRVSVLGVIAATCSHQSLAVFHITYRLLWISLIFTGSISAATGVKLSIALSSGDPIHAKTLTRVGILLATPLVVSLATAFFFLPERFAHIFTNNNELIDEFAKIRYSFSAVMLLMGFNIVLERIPLSMNRTRLVSAVGLVSSWMVQLPAVLLSTNFWQMDLNGVYTGVAIGYAFLDVALIVVIISSDFELSAKEAMERSLGYLVSDTVSSVSSASKSGFLRQPIANRFRAPVGELERIASMDGSNHRHVMAPTPFANIAEYEEAFLKSSEEQEYEDIDPEDGDDDVEYNAVPNRLDYSTGIPPPPSLGYHHVNDRASSRKAGLDPSAPATDNLADVTF